MNKRFLNPLEPALEAETEKLLPRSGRGFLPGGNMGRVVETLDYPTRWDSGKEWLF